MKRLAVALGLGAALYGGLLRPWLVRFGSTAEERARGLPGDGVVQGDVQQITRAITIAAPPAAVWPWFVQMGQDRGGFYSHDRLERLFGARIRNAEKIVSEWQSLHVGDLVRTYPDAFGKRDLGWRVALLEPERVLVLRSETSGWSWTLALEPNDGGTGTRLLSRERKVRRRGGGRLFDLFVFDLAHFVMDTGVLHGVRDRAERDRPVDGVVGEAP
jgi:hypothetical protein